jgi:CheY-like chemotaxis protein
VTANNPTIQSSSVLVVDDNEMNRDMLCSLLEAIGHKASVAENGRLGLEMIKAKPYDLVLLDVMMPEMNGYQVLEHMKSDSRGGRLPAQTVRADASESPHRRLPRKETFARPGSTASQRAGRMEQVAGTTRRGAGDAG